ncbi:MAG: hypothetical protein HY911_06545 [Desulfobacterales bacterium]|nr:hypothetical protein [Desulfobacterales bacterium]
MAREANKILRKHSATSREEEKKAITATKFEGQARIGRQDLDGVAEQSACQNMDFLAPCFKKLHLVMKTAWYILVKYLCDNGDELFHGPA